MRLLRFFNEYWTLIQHRERSIIVGLEGSYGSRPLGIKCLVCEYGFIRLWK